MTFPVSAFWRRLDEPGHDSARIQQTSSGYLLSGMAAFRERSAPAALWYSLELNADWTTRSGRVRGFASGRDVDLRILRTDRGWRVGNREGLAPAAVDLDFGFTPATNYAQLQRVALAVGEEASFDVAWMDTDGAELAATPQRYRRVSATAYEYWSPAFGYHAILTTAPDGFVALYPDLWTREG